MTTDPRQLADRTITQIHDLVEDLHRDRLITAHRTYTLNALHLVRDALLDLNALHVLLSDLIDQQGALIETQIDERILHGPSHANYHRISSQIRAVAGSGHQHAKRLLNQCAYLTGAFLAHGIALRDGSFGKQYASLQRIDVGAVSDPRSRALLDLLASRGQALEVHNDYRDQYIEHVTPRRTREQPRPTAGGSGISHHEANPIRPASGHVVQIEPGWVHMQDVSDNGVPINIFYVHAHGAFDEDTPPSDATFRGIALDTIMNRGHFRHTEYHGHVWIREDLAAHGDGYSKMVQPNALSESDLDQVFEDVVQYVFDLVLLCRTNGRELGSPDHL